MMTSANVEIASGRRFARRRVFGVTSIATRLCGGALGETSRLANHGETMLEIAEEFELPGALARTWSSRGYYGSVNHSVEAIYQRYPPRGVARASAARTAARPRPTNEVSR